MGRTAERLSDEEISFASRAVGRRVAERLPGWKGKRIYPEVVKTCRGRCPQRLAVCAVRRTSRGDLTGERKCVYSPLVVEQKAASCRKRVEWLEARAEGDLTRRGKRV